MDDFKSNVTTVRMGGAPRAFIYDEPAMQSFEESYELTIKENERLLQEVESLRLEIAQLKESNRRAKE